MENNQLREYNSHLSRQRSDFSCHTYQGTFLLEQRDSIALHSHSEFEFWVTLDGSVSLRVDNDMFSLHAGEGVFINSLQLHSVPINHKSSYTYLAVVFSAKFLDIEGNRIYQKYLKPVINGTLKIPHSLNKEQIDRIIEIRKLCTEKKFGYELKVKSHLLIIMSELIEQADKITVPKTSHATEYIRAAIRYIHQHYSEKITLQDIATSIGISREYFCRIFSQLADVSPIEYINNYRLRQSIELLNHTDLTVAEISNQCGFQSCSYYNKLFRQFMGMSPSEYRKKGPHP